MLNAILAFAIAIAIVSFGIFLIRPLPNLSRRQAVAVGIFWLLALLSIDLIFGANTYSTASEEVEAGIATHLLWLRQSPGTGWNHMVGGGVDLSATTALLGQYLSLDLGLMRLLTDTFSLSVANIVQKAQLAAFAYVGAYRLYRRVHPSGRQVPAVCAAIFTLGNYYMTVVGWQTLGHALIPLTAYVLVFRTQARFFWAEACAVSVLYASSCLVTHTTLGLFGAVLAVAILTPGINWRRIILAFGIVVVTLAANWHEQLWGLVQLAPYASRTLKTDLEYFVEPFSNTTLFVAMAAAGAGMALVRRRPGDAARLGLVLTVILGLGFAVDWLVTAVPALAPLAPIRWGRINNSLFVISPMLLALGIERQAQGLTRRVMVALACASMIFLFTWNKTYRVVEWLSEGGLTSLTAVLPQLQEHPWYESDHSARVLTIPYRISPMAAPLAGLDAVDGFVNLSQRSLDGLLRFAGHKRLGHELDYKCCKSYLIQDYFDLDALRLANVGFILSVLPLEGPRIRQVAGPTGAAAIPRSADSALDRLRGFARLIHNHPGVRVYALEPPVPRVFVAEAIEIIAQEAGDSDLARAAVRAGLAGAAAVRAADLPPGVEAEPSLQIISHAMVAQGVHLQLKAPEGGVVVFNVPWLPFWTAQSDGQPLPVFPANLAQMAIAIPAGATQVALEFRRPGLKESLATRW